MIHIRTYIHTEWVSTAAAASSCGLEEDFGWDLGGSYPPKFKTRGKPRKARNNNAAAQPRSPRLSADAAVLDDGFVAFLVEVDESELWETQVCY